jgi:hypothetical protein
VTLTLDAGDHALWVPEPGRDPHPIAVVLRDGCPVAGIARRHRRTSLYPDVLIPLRRGDVIRYEGQLLTVVDVSGPHVMVEPPERRLTDDDFEPGFVRDEEDRW